MALRAEKAFLNAVTYTSADFSSYQEKVFGSVGTCSYETAGLSLEIQGGGLLLGGYFYKLTGSLTMTIPANQTRYIIAKKTKFADTDPEFDLAEAVTEDNEKYYIATIFRVIASTNALKVERIGGYPSALYGALEEQINHVVQVHSGTANPTNSLGRDGDVYIKY